MHMMGYLGGDGETYAARRATEGDLSFTAHLTDSDQLLSIIVMQSGEIGLTWEDARTAGAKTETVVYQIGQIEPHPDDPKRMHFELYETPIDTRRPIRSIRA